MEMGGRKCDLVNGKFCTEYEERKNEMMKDSMPTFAIRHDSRGLLSNDTSLLGFVDHDSHLMEWLIICVTNATPTKPQ